MAMKWGLLAKVTVPGPSGVSLRAGSIESDRRDPDQHPGEKETAMKRARRLEKPTGPEENYGLM